MCNFRPLNVNQFRHCGVRVLRLHCINACLSAIGGLNKTCFVDISSSSTAAVGRAERQVLIPMNRVGVGASVELFRGCDALDRVAWHRTVHLDDPLTEDSPPTNKI